MNLHDKDFLVSAFMKVKFEQLIYVRGRYTVDKST